MSEPAARTLSTRLRRTISSSMVALIAAFVLIASSAATRAQSPLPVPEKAPGDLRVSIIGCLREQKPMPALARYIEHKPDLILWIGDNVYPDAKTDPAIIQRSYDTLAANADFQKLRTIAPAMITWDDHDYGDNNEDKNYILKDQSRAMFLKFWGLEKEIPADRPGIYTARLMKTEGGTLQVIMLDNRWNRDEPGPAADMLGETQWALLAKQLDQPADLRLIISGSQILLPKEAGSETWDEYPKSRARLFDLIRTKQLDRVLFNTGDQHYGEVCRDRGLLGYDAVELQFAGVNQTEKPEFNPTRVSPCAMALHSDAFIDIQWTDDEHEPAHVLFRVFDSTTGQAEIAYRVNLSELTVPQAIR